MRRLVAALCIGLTAIGASVASASDAGPVRSAVHPPEEVGTRAGRTYLRKDDFMTYEVGEVRAVHYAEVAAAYGALRLAAATGDATLSAGVAARRERLIASDIPNSRNHVDANVYGVWPLALAAAGDESLKTDGLGYADDQWAIVGADGLTTQARYWIDDIWMIGLLQIEAWRATGERKYQDRLR